MAFWLLWTHTVPPGLLHPPSRDTGRCCLLSLSLAAGAVAGLMTATPAGEWESCCSQQELNDVGENYRASHQKRRWILMWIWMRLVNWFKKRKEKEKSLPRSFILAKGNGCEGEAGARRSFFCWWFGLCHWTPLKRFATPTVLLF